MATVSVIRWSELEDSLRLDAEYYRRDNLRMWAVLAASATRRVHSFAAVTDGIHASPDMEDSGVLYLSAKCVRDGLLELSDALRISRQQHSENRRSQLEADDIAITTVGTIGNCAVITPELLPANIDRHVGIIRVQDSDIDPWYVSTFLNSRYGRFQTAREATGNVQLNLFIPKIQNLLVPRLRCEDEVARLARHARRITVQAEGEYARVEAELLSRIGWVDLARRGQELVFIVDCASTVRAGRCDPEHFHPLLGRLRARLAERGSATLGELWLSCSKGVQPDNYSDDGDTIVIKSKNVTERGIDLDSCERSWMGGSAAYELRPGDLLVNSTGRGTLGRASVFPNVEGRAVAAVDIQVCRLDAGRADPDYVALFMNSPIGLAQSDRFQSGSSGQLHLYPARLAELSVYIPRMADGSPDIAWQHSLSSRLRAARDERDSSRRSLGEAKRMIEDEIESSARNPGTALRS